MRTTILALIVVVFASPAFADERKAIDWKPYAALTAGQMFDVVTTQQAFKRGCVEANPLHGRSRPSTAQVIGLKVAMVAPATLAAYLLEKNGHPKIAAALGYGGGAYGAAVGTWNLSQSCGR